MDFNGLDISGSSASATKCNTLKRKYSSGATDFSNWLRHQPEIDSEYGYRATDVDYVWRQEKTGEIMLLEEKCQMHYPSACQRKSIAMIDQAMRLAYPQTYRGAHLIQFELGSPADGRIYIAGAEVSRDQLIEFLQFNAPAEMYQENWLINGSEGGTK